MAVFTWDPELYDAGVAAMNAQHRGLIDLMNKIDDRNKANAAKTELLGLIGQLAELTNRHFTAEETYMEKIRFTDLKSHKMIHTRLLRDFTGHVEKFKAGSGPLGADFFNFLSLWLRAHIQHLDMQYAKHCGGAKASA